MKAALERYRQPDQQSLVSALSVLHNLRFFEALDAELVNELGGRTLSSDSESDLVAVCREIRHRRAYLKFLENETAELVTGPDSNGD